MWVSKFEYTPVLMALSRLTALPSSPVGPRPFFPFSRRAAACRGVICLLWTTHISLEAADRAVTSTPSEEIEQLDRVGNPDFLEAEPDEAYSAGEASSTEIYLSTERKCLEASLLDETYVTADSHK